tara:strand:- start:132 stop:473 length:342 start_codon:yes stop_codon:yes gene_type:complete
MWLLIAFIAIPLIEIALFIQIGGFIGLWPTLAIVLGTAILGSSLVRSQGARELSKLQGSFATLNDPTEPLANGAMIIFAGALLLTPGFSPMRWALRCCFHRFAPRLSNTPNPK